MDTRTRPWRLVRLRRLSRLNSHSSESAVLDELGFIKRLAGEQNRERKLRRDTFP